MDVEGRLDVGLILFISSLRGVRDTSGRCDCELIPFESKECSALIREDLCVFEIAASDRELFKLFIVLEETGESVPVGTSIRVTFSGSSNEPPFSPATACRISFLIPMKSYTRSLEQVVLGLYVRWSWTKGRLTRTTAQMTSSAQKIEGKRQSHIPAIPGGGPCIRSGNGVGCLADMGH